MKHIKPRSMKYMSKLCGLMLFLTFQAAMSQEETTENIQEEVDTTITDSVVVKKDSIKIFKKVKVDGVAAVIGDYVILESDIDKNFLSLETQGVSIKDITRCQMLGKLMEDKLYAHQAVQDSIEVSEAEISGSVERQLDYLVSEIGSMEKLLQFYRKNSEESFREELAEIIKTQQLSERMRSKIVDDVEITPDEVRQWFNNIPKEERPVFGDEVEIAQIVKKPKPSEEEVKATIEKLKKIKADVVDGGASFAIKQTLYSEDPGKSQNGGVYRINKKSGFVKEFKDVAFSMQQGEVSEPFETEFGWHILLVEKIRGQELDVRHILLMPEISEKAIEEAKKELTDIRNKILDGAFTFEEAARNFSDEEETKYDGGILTNPSNLDKRFELTKLDPTFYAQVSGLEGNEISQPIAEQTRTGVNYKIIKVNARYKEHIADYSQDYIKIKELALKEKQMKAISDWMDEKIKDTYISVAPDNRECNFANNWLKK
ncbi:peptidylprolyl isomerase [Abyssalbus ytuae]|uniref:Peptidylprolyl isomerase n=1 Tax=Abyssalbus ytuae TaxID=2926907 RepID=A0A9E6ZT10_9FLAO|nr:peptidylprolyl isomerase [Abyssalbus ytuae]UOB18303.1 peptidylprolyl isomerase [Abyssalbus ytuae]